MSGKNSQSSYFNCETGNETGCETGREVGCETGREVGCETGHLYKLNKSKPNNKKEKKAYGEFAMVLLTDDELQKLQDNHLDTWEEWIKRLDLGKAMKGYEYSNDYAAILSWIENEEKQETQKAFEELMAEADFM